MFTDHMADPEQELRYVPPRDPNAPEEEGDEDESAAAPPAERASVAE
jgi:hypothetical protein